MERVPRIAVILDENTSGDGSRYEASKRYFTAIRDAGGLPFGIPYLSEIVGPVVEEFDGLLCVGGRFAYPDEWYLQGKPSRAPPSERFAIERDITAEFLRRKKPILGICAGMQLLAGLHGCRLCARQREGRRVHGDVRSRCDQRSDADRRLQRRFGSCRPHQRTGAAIDDRL